MSNWLALGFAAFLGFMAGMSTGLKTADTPTPHEARVLEEILATTTTPRDAMCEQIIDIVLEAVAEERIGEVEARAD